jgi:hypothetical protein
MDDLWLDLQKKIGGSLNAIQLSKTMIKVKKPQKKNKNHRNMVRVVPGIILLMQWAWR